MAPLKIFKGWSDSHINEGRRLVLLTPPNMHFDVLTHVMSLREFYLRHSALTTRPSKLGTLSYIYVPLLYVYRKSRHTSDQDDEYFTISKGSSLLSTEMEELSGVYYRPRTRETKSTYEILLSFIQKMIGDQVQ